MKVRNTLLATAVAAGLGMAALPAQAGWLDWLLPSQPEETPEDVVTEPGEYPDGLRPAIFVGNNWDGTIDVIDGDNYEILGRVNGIPDYEERMDEIKGDFWRYNVFLGILQLIGEGNDQYVDDMYSTNDGELLIVSRPSFADVVALDLETGRIVLRALERVNEELKTAIAVITHNAAIAGMGDRVVRMSSGRIASDESNPNRVHIDEIEW